MSKNINLVLPNFADNVEGFQNISIYDLDSIYSYSADMISCGMVNLFESKEFWENMSIILDKLKPNGTFIVKTYNIKNICKSYITDNIDDQLFLRLVSNMKNTFNIDDYLQFCSSNNCAVIDYKNDGIFCTIAMVKNNG